MAVRRILPDLAYGIGDALIPLAPIPIIAKRDPGVADQALLGTTWVNESTGAVFILARIVSNASDWVTSPVLGGSGTFTDLTTTGAGGLTVSGTGGISVGAGAFTVDSSGDVVVGGNLSVAGTFTFTGTLDLTSSAEIIIASTYNGAPSILIEANGGILEQILIESLQGTGAGSIDIASTSGGVEVSAGLNTATAVHLTASNAAGGVTATAGTGGITLATTNGAIALTSGTAAINIGADAVAHAIVAGNSTGATSIALNTGTGSSLNLGTNAIAHTVSIGNNTGASVVAINGGTGAAGAINIATTANDVPITIGNSTGATAILLNAGTSGVGVGTNAIAHTVSIGNATGASSVVVNVGTGAASFAANAIDHTTTVGSTTGTSSTVIQGGTAGVSLVGPMVVLPGPVNIYTGAGAPSGALGINVGDMYINTTAASATTRLYICTVAGTFTNITCAS